MADTFGSDTSQPVFPDITPTSNNTIISESDSNDDDNYMLIDDITRIKKNPTQFILLIFSAIGSIIFFSLMKSYKGYVFQQTFIEQDPGLSFPYVENQQVSYINLIFLCGLAPQCVLAFAYILFIIFDKYEFNEKNRHKHRNILFLSLTYIGFVTSLFLTAAVTDALKISYGEPRPSLFGICNYQGYRDAVNSGNFTNYYAATRFGSYGDTRNCLNQDDVDDAFMSFPSGHASLMFTSTIYVSLIFFMFKKRSVLYYFFGIIIFCGYFTLATWVCYTRVRDYMHKSSDVLAGALIGSIIAWLVYTQILDTLRTYNMLKVFKMDSLRGYEYSYSYIDREGINHTI